MAIFFLRWRFIGGFFVFLLGVLALAVIGGGLALRASLPQLDGEVALEGIGATVTVERDGAGVPTIRGADRVDVAMALGFLHAQERFFQMDLQRRRASGELAEIFGQAAVQWDARVRAHRFRTVARAVMAGADEKDRVLLEAYADGVNAGLEALDERPFEYLLLRSRPRPWTAEDSILTTLSMFLQLNSWNPDRELAHAALNELLPQALYDFLAAPGTEFDAPMLGDAFKTGSPPGPEVIDLRLEKPEVSSRAVADNVKAGSNGWAVAGSRTSHGGAILVADMHRGLMVPNVRYRASLSWPAPAWNDEVIRVTGVTLPGLPVVVAGSNGRVAWGFTNSYGDWVDVVLFDPLGFEAYIGPDGPREYESWTEKIVVAGADDLELEFKATLWGPVVSENHRGRPVALRWTAHHAEAVGGRGLTLLETARDVDEALAAGPAIGMPPQNLMVADSQQRIGWTIVGRIPRRVDCDDIAPGNPSSPECRWSGWVEARDYPRIVDPPSGQVWTANARVVDGEWLRILGDGGYALGARAGQIRDALEEMENITEEDLLGLQLDDRALFLGWWRERLLEVLTPQALSQDPRLLELRQVVEGWSGHAGVEDAGYRMVRAFRLYARSLVLDPLVAPCKTVETPCGWDFLGQREGPVRRLLVERPPHLLNPRFADWDSLLLAAADRVLTDFSKGDSTPADHTWGERNTVRIRHPLSGALPQWLSDQLDMPALALPGDVHMPRVQGPAFGASERFVVSPGREIEGIFHMPGGQSGHPLSPYYGVGHGSWVEGLPTPFLPGPVKYTLILGSP
ncbi:MAG: penicillin acylase family protein [Thermoanaerobaculales bacterium]|nr:penicillin acylase family protein [Thermoanaerobaculales bacterium]